jgi:hypothetical protein
MMLKLNIQPLKPCYGVKREDKIKAVDLIFPPKEDLMTLRLLSRNQGKCCSAK